MPHHVSLYTVAPCDVIKLCGQYSAFQCLYSRRLFSAMSWNDAHRDTRDTSNCGTVTEVVHKSTLITFQSRTPQPVAL
jgi:hypothetical protein